MESEKTLKKQESSKMEKLTIARCKTRVATRCYTRLAAVALHDYMLLEYTYTHLHYNFSVSKKQNYLYIGTIPYHHSYWS